MIVLRWNIFVHASNCDMKTRCEIDMLAKKTIKKTIVSERNEDRFEISHVTVGYLRIIYVYTWKFPETRILPKMGIAAEEGRRHISISFSMHVHIFSLRVENPPPPLSLSLSLSLSFLLCNSDTWLRCYDNKIDTALPIQRKLRCGKIRMFDTIVSRGCT